MSLYRLFPCFQFRLDDNINKLDYSNNILAEGFPHVWEYERTLEELNISSTRINYLPPQLFYCQCLKVLLVNSNNLENVPEAVGSLRQLQELNLSRNFISDVPDNIKSCKSLTRLDLSCNSLQKLPDAITCLISLQELILNETYIEFLPANFGRLVNLRIVELRSNNLVSLPKSMHRLTNLQRLDIGCNEFRKMPAVVGELKNLRELWFDFNQIKTLPQQIGKLRELVHCEANGNCLSDLPNDIGNWFNVEVFSVSINNLTTFPFSVGMLKSLVTLKCESNELTELPDCISNLENLEELAVSHNKLVCLPNTIGMLRKLRYLFVDNNNLQKLPDDICSCSALNVVSVSRNKLSVLPDNIGHLKHLKVLNIVQNNIATFPVSLLNLTSLTSLWISNNQSQPLIPLQYTEISNKTHLTCFMLPQLGTKQKANSLNEYDGKQCKSSAQFERALDEAFPYVTSNRRICFAEEATILHTDSQILELSLPTCEKGIYSNLLTDKSNLKVSKHFSENEICEGLNRVSVFNSKDVLMRSPTPYPKDLRLMAKYAQLTQHKFLNSCNNDNAHESIDLLENKSSVQGQINCSNNKYVLHEPDKTCEENFNSNCEIKNIKLQYYLLQNHSREQNKKIHTKLATRQQFVLDDNSPKPPPYCIARCFSKKSVEDLTKYEFTRKQQEQHHNFQFCETNIDKKSLWQKIDLQNKLTPNNINFEYENNECQPFAQKIDSRMGNTGSEKTRTVSTVQENKFLNVVDIPETSNTIPKIKCDKSKTKWLFGVHKNPRVIQVNVNWESGRDFDIDILPNKEGIFVISTVLESNSSQLIHPLDKLLEVEGVDFTHISLNEARQVLQNSRPSISIMLSRK